MGGTSNIVVIILTAFLLYIILRWITILRKEYDNLKSGEDFFTFARFKNAIIFGGIIILPLIVVNLVSPDRVTLSPQEAVERAWEEKDSDKLPERSERLLAEDTTNVDYHFFYIFSHTRLNDLITSDEIKEMYEPYISAEDTSLRDLGLLMSSLGLTWDPLQVDVRPLLKQVSDQDKKYVAFAYGTYYYDRTDYARAIKYLKQELKNDGFAQGATESLHRIYELTDDQSALDRLYYNEKAFEFLPLSQRRDVYYHNGDWGLYFRTAFQRQEKSFNYFGLIAALFVTLVWVVYIRSIDVFEPEPWWSIITVFILGSILTYLVYPLSDYLEFSWDFTLTGDLWNDWWYCFIGIGMVEEIAKMLPWLIFVFLIRKTREPFDYIVYASISALGFAFTENLLYYEESQLTSIDIRGLMAAVSHMFDASIIAYSFILMKHRYGNKKWRFLLPVAGLIIASAAHGFYDFWLISPKARMLWILTYVFFMFSLHLWTTMKNNALNNSTFFHSSTKAILEKVNFRLILSMLAIFMIEYLLVGLAYGKEPANSRLAEGSLMTGLLIFYISSTFKGMDLKRGVWHRFQSPMEWFSLPSFSGPSRSKKPLPDLTGTLLRFYAPKNNPYLGGQLPVSGILEKRMTMGGDPNWYMVQLRSKVSYGGLIPDRVMVRHKDEGGSLKDDKIAVYFMMIPPATILTENTPIEDLRYMGRVYSRPIDEYGNTLH